LLYDPAERMEGEGVLSESGGDLGFVLWRTARDLALWAGTPHSKRSQLFAEGSEALRVSRVAAAQLPDAISSPVNTLNSMLTLGSRAHPGIVTICCLEVATWARNGGRVHTAVAFAQAGALVSPDFAEAALHTGICAREAGQLLRAGTWLRRALSLARQEEDREAYAAALVELGTVYEQQPGGIERAERYYRKAFKAGRRAALPEPRLKALQGLHRIALARGDTASAGRLGLAITRHARRRRPERPGRKHER
jgi:tetratricopeptide (TPR) repeat protein